MTLNININYLKTTRITHGKERSSPLRSAAGYVAIIQSSKLRTKEFRSREEHEGIADESDEMAVSHARPTLWKPSGGKQIAVEQYVGQGLAASPGRAPTLPHYPQHNTRVMDGEEEESWLSSVISQVDRLALSIGGYEEEPTEHGFSDDESDGSTSEEDEDASDPSDSGFEDALEDADDDSGFEDAIESPDRRVSTRPQAGNRVQAPEEGCVPSKTMEDIRLPPKSSTNKAKATSLPGTQPHSSSQDRLGMGDVQTSEETLVGDAPHKSRQELTSERAPAVSSADNPPPVSVTPCHSQDRFDEGGMPASERGPPQQQGGGGGDLNPIFRTPAHSRDRNAFNREPPLAVAPAARSEGSRRGHRERNRSKEDLGTTSAEATRTYNAKESTPAHASPSLSTSRSASNMVSKYSHMNDTNWLKPQTDFLEATHSQPEVGAAAAPGGYAEFRRKTLSTSAEETPASVSAAMLAVGTAGAAPPSAAWRNERRPSPDTEQQCRLDILDDGDAKDLNVEESSEEALDEHARDTETAEEELTGAEAVASDTLARDAEPDEEGLAETEAVASAYSENGLAVADDLHADLREEQGDVNGHDEPHEGRGAKQVIGEDREVANKDEVDLSDSWSDGVEHPDGLTDETATIGAKRASVENGRSAEELDWMMNSPVGFAPSKRGKTKLEYPLAVMRHSARLDDAIHERQRKLGAIAAGSGRDENSDKKGSSDGTKGLDNGAGDGLEAVLWPDRALRPYDSPIVDVDLPARQAKELSRHGMDSQTLILCSPFRRCLQTAGVVARTLGVAGVTVNLEVGERMDRVRREIAELNLALGEDSDATLDNSQPAPVFSYLEEKDMREALGAGVQLERIVGEQPPEEESGVEAKQRFIATIAKLREEQLREGPVLVVAHGDTLDAAGESLASQIVFEADYCAWALFNLDTHNGYVAESYGIQMIPL